MSSPPTDENVDPQSRKSRRQDAEIEVLHVDNDTTFADPMATWLEQERRALSVTVEARAADALDRLADESFDCIVSAYRMPGTDGIELLRAVREDHPDLPFILVTGTGSEEVASEAISAGVTDYVPLGGGSTYSLLVRKIDNAVERQRAVERLQEREQELARQNQRLEEFASVVSHDLRNPLKVANGNLELAIETGNFEYLEKVDAALDRMGTMIEDLLTLAREGQAVREQQPVSLRNVVNEAWMAVRDDAAVLQTNPGVDDATLLADRGRLKQVFENLFRNAVEHAGPAVTVRVSRDRAGFSVADDGPGVPPGEREHVFEHGYSTGEEGTGFGLAIVQTIVEAHGWEIAVTDSEDGGARFEVTGVEWT